MKKIITEFCQNFIGDRRILKKMIFIAKDCGATHAKIQSYRSEELTFRQEFEIGGNSGIIRPYQQEFERIKSADLSDEDIAWFVDECKKNEIKPLITVFTRGRIKKLAIMDWDEVKVASYDCASYPLLNDLKKHFKHLFISTGACYDEEIRKASELLGGTSFSFLHCVTKYPTSLADTNLARIKWLRQFTSSVGYSDHSLVSRDGILASLGALALGADIIERHFTILDSDKSKDGPVSITPSLLAELSDWSRKDKEEVVEYLDSIMPEWRKIMTGSASRELTEEELKNRQYYKGRFATKNNNDLVYNWDDKDI